MSQILLYQSEDGRTKLDVRMEGETLWVNQKQLTELFGKAKGTISEHIKHIFEDQELATPFHPSPIPSTAPPSAPPQKQIPSSNEFGLELEPPVVRLNLHGHRIC